MKKGILSLGVAAAMVLSVPAVISANSAEITSVVDESFVLEGEVGAVIEHGGLTFVRVESAPETHDPIITPYASKSDFNIKLSGTEKSQAFTIDKEYKYVKVYINNTSSGSIKFTITKGSATGNVVSGTNVTIPAKESWNVYSTNAWGASTYYANYTSGKVEMSGTSSARLASTYEELDI